MSYVSYHHKIWYFLSEHNYFSGKIECRLLGQYRIWDSCIFFLIGHCFGVFFWVGLFFVCKISKNYYEFSKFHITRLTDPKDLGPNNRLVWLTKQELSIDIYQSTQVSLFKSIYLSIYLCQSIHIYLSLYLSHYISIDRYLNLFISINLLIYTCRPVLIYLSIYARGVMVIVVGNRHGDTSSNPGRDWLHFT